MTIATEPIRLGQAGTIFFDGSCGLCTMSANRLHQLISHRGFGFVPLQTPGVAETLHLDEHELDLEIKLRTPDGQVLGGANALILISRHIWWTWPMWLMAQIPGITPLFRFIYRHVAQNRRRISTACGLDRRALFICPYISLNTETTDKTVKGLRVIDWLIAAIPFAAVLTFGRTLPPWAYMWLMTLGVWLGFKWLMWRDEAARHAAPAPPLRTLLYFIAWPSTDARPFFKPVDRELATRSIDWLRPSVMLACGIALIWWIARIAMPINLLLGGWAGMIGAVLILHFGLFHLIALSWRSNGIAVEPLMNKPTHASSVADFWQRWNSGFNDIAFRLFFRRLHRRFGLVTATLTTFFFSGVVHDVVISLPAHGGYGLPTLYFMIQGVAILFEKSPLGRQMNPLLHRVMTYVTLIAPVGLLFHPPFVRVVFVPFLAAIHAI